MTTLCTSERAKAGADKLRNEQRAALRLVIDRTEHGASVAEACEEARAYLRCRAAHPAGTHTEPGADDEARLLNAS